MRAALALAVLLVFRRGTAFRGGSPARRPFPRREAGARLTPPRGGKTLLALALACSIGCEEGRFSGTLDVEVRGPAEAKLGLFNHPSAGAEEQSVTLETGRDRCEIRSSFPQGATAPRQQFDVVEGRFSITFDESLPAVPLTLAAWVDADDDDDLDFTQPPSEPCAAAVKEFERGPLAITQIDSLGGGEFRVVAEDGSSIVDEDASGWVFTL